MLRIEVLLIATLVYVHTTSCLGYKLDIMEHVSIFLLQAVSRLLDENKSTLNADDIESGIWELSNSKLKPMFEQRLQSGRQHLGSLVRQLDSIFCAGAVFLRRNSTARMWSLVYLVGLHLWVVYILMSHSPVSEEARSGAVISLENINNTGGV